MLSIVLPAPPCTSIQGLLASLHGGWSAGRVPNLNRLNPFEPPEPTDSSASVIMIMRLGFYLMIMIVIVPVVAVLVALTWFCVAAVVDWFFLPVLLARLDAVFSSVGQFEIGTLKTSSAVLLVVSVIQTMLLDLINFKFKLSTVLVMVTVMVITITRGSILQEGDEHFPCKRPGYFRT